MTSMAFDIKATRKHIIGGDIWMVEFPQLHRCAAASAGVAEILVLDSPYNHARAVNTVDVL
ncbi:hypothetical protein D3872_18705 [Massilia cavernae]|uniref:Uncharacterized protein n=1 Tax=Massilia cavernae TaxID=2320864 RepID=A0A418XGK9_9BURK|nr:hypothetical protein D3872_18705 [Massilia cavernae]